MADLADAISGSFRVFSQFDRDPMRSVNFITAHDGFTLNDLVSYDEKHNQANGEDNRDGNNHNQNDSWNCGAEGPIDDPQVEALRNRQLRNFVTILLLSQGRPMFLMGDEVRRPSKATTTPTARTTRSVGLIGAWLTPTVICCALSAVCSVFVRAASFSATGATGLNPKARMSSGTGSVWVNLIGAKIRTAWPLS